MNSIGVVFQKCQVVDMIDSIDIIQPDAQCIAKNGIREYVVAG